MADGILPTLRLAVLCGRVVYDAEGRVVGLLDLVSVVHVPPDRTEPMPVPCVLYLQLAGALGTVELTAEVLEVRDGGGWRYQSPAVLATFDAVGDRDLPHTATVALDRLEFPGPGLYELFVRCDGASLHDPAEAIPVPYPPVRISVYRLPAAGPEGGDDGDPS